MAVPQKKNGYIAIATELFEALCRTRIGGETRQVFDAILRKTYGFNKKSDVISLSQFCKMTQMPKSSVARAIRHLKVRNLIKTVPLKHATEYQINKDYETWNGVFTYDRMKIFERDGYMCHICNCVKSVTELQVDHVVPLWLNGTNEDDNLKAACAQCNKRKGAERLHYQPPVTKLTQGQKVNRKGDKTVSKTVTKSSQTKDNTKDNIQKTAKSSNELLENEQWQELIDSFEKVNPMYEMFYRNKTQRHALLSIVRKMGYAKTLWLIKHLKDATAVPYAPRITTPVQLRDKIGDLQTFWEQEKQKKIIGNNKGRGLA